MRRVRVCRGLCGAGSARTALAQRISHFPHTLVGRASPSRCSVSDLRPFVPGEKLQAVNLLGKSNYVHRETVCAPSAPTALPFPVENKALSVSLYAAGRSCRAAVRLGSPGQERNGAEPGASCSPCAYNFSVGFLA